MKVQAITCPSCKQIIYSRARHDFRSCDCSKYSIDGGQDYIRVLHSTETPPLVFEMEVNATREELYNDWNLNKNKFGKVSNV